MSGAAPVSALSAGSLSGSPLAAFFVHESGLLVRGRRSTWWRLSFLLLSTIVVVIGGQLGLAVRLGEGGLVAFRALMMLNAYFVFLLTMTSFSKAISEEREQGTLDMLRVTGLSTFALLAGKGTSKYLRAMLLFLMQAPLCALCLTLGGISLLEMGAAYLLLAAVAFLACHMALFWSVVCKTSRGAGQTTIGVLFVLYAVPPGLVSMASSNPELFPKIGVAAGEWLARVNPLAAYRTIMTTGIVPWRAIAFHFGVGLVFLGWATAIFERTCRQAKPVELEAARPARGNQPRRGPLPRVGARPFTWKEYHFAAGGARSLRHRWIAYPIIAVCLATLGYDWGASDAAFLHRLAGSMLMVGLFGVCSEIAYSATRLFGAERANQTLGDIAILPMRTRRIVGEKILGYVPSLLAPIACVTVGAMLTPGNLWSSVFSGVNWFVVLYVALQIALILVLTVHFSFRQNRTAFGGAFGMVAMSNALLIGVSASLLDVRPEFLESSLLMVLGVLSVATIWLIVRLIRLLPYHLEVAAAK
jgi:ABC-type transport system involved in cytochrome c biogenesis permease component